MTEPARQDAVGTLIDFPLVLRIVMQQFIGRFPDPEQKIEEGIRFANHA